MKTIKLTKREAHDVSLVLTTTVKEKAGSMDFKEILQVQKFANSLLAGVKDFADKSDEWNKQRAKFVENANKKISEFKQSIMKTSEKNKELDESYKEKVDDFVQITLADVKTQIDEEITPAMKELNEGLGKEEVSFELEESKHKMVIDVFEKYAKEYYTDKKIMIETYEKLCV